MDDTIPDSHRPSLSDVHAPVIGGAIEAIRTKEAKLSIENQVLQKKVADLQKENLEVLKKWQEVKVLHQEALSDIDHKDSQLDRTMGERVVVVAVVLVVVGGVGRGEVVVVVVVVGGGDYYY